MKDSKKPQQASCYSGQIHAKHHVWQPCWKIFREPQTVIPWKPLIDPMLPKINKNCIQDILRVMIDYRPNPSNTDQRQLVLEHARVIEASLLCWRRGNVVSRVSSTVYLRRHLPPSAMQRETCRPHLSFSYLMQLFLMQTHFCIQIPLYLTLGSPRFHYNAVDSTRLAPVPTLCCHSLRRVVIKKSLF